MGSSRLCSSSRCPGPSGPPLAARSSAPTWGPAQSCCWMELGASRKGFEGAGPSLHWLTGTVALGLWAPWLSASASVWRNTQLQGGQPCRMPCMPCPSQDNWACCVSSCHNTGIGPTGPLPNPAAGTSPSPHELSAFGLEDVWGDEASHWQAEAAPLSLPLEHPPRPPSALASGKGFAACPTGGKKNSRRPSAAEAQASTCTTSRLNTNATCSCDPTRASTVVGEGNIKSVPWLPPWQSPRRTG